MNDYSNVIGVLSDELNRVFGNDGVRNLLMNKIDKLEEWSLELDSDSFLFDCYMNTRDDLIEYIEILDGKLPF